jgi:carbamoyltransferase
VYGNELLRRRYPRIPVFVPPFPNDGGLALGAALQYSPPRSGPKDVDADTNDADDGKRGAENGDATATTSLSSSSSLSTPVRQLWHFAGPPLWDAAALPALAARYCARRVSVVELARLLVAGAVVGVARGRAEVGPRALGHRIVLAFPSPGRSGGVASSGGDGAIDSGGGGDKSDAYDDGGGVARLRRVLGSRWW